MLVLRNLTSLESIQRRHVVAKRSTNRTHSQRDSWYMSVKGKRRNSDITASLNLQIKTITLPLNSNLHAASVQDGLKSEFCVKPLTSVKYPECDY